MTDKLVAVDNWYVLVFVIPHHVERGMLDAGSLRQRTILREIPDQVRNDEGE